MDSVKVYTDEEIDEMVRQRDALSERISDALEARSEQQYKEIEEYWGDKLVGKFYVNYFIDTLVVSLIDRVSVRNKYSMQSNNTYELVLSGSVNLRLSIGGNSPFDGTHDNGAGMQLATYSVQHRLALSPGDWSKFDSPFISLCPPEQVVNDMQYTGFLDVADLSNRNGHIKRLIALVKDSIVNSISDECEANFAAFRKAVKKRK